MCKIGISPLRSSSKRRFEHERHGSEQLPRPRPLSIVAQPTAKMANPAMQHMKRASIYVSDASILLSHRNPVLSPTSPHDSVLSPASSEHYDAPDHYDILELTPTAARDDVLAAFRRLRVVYFQSDAKKYRALQTAMEVLANPVTRQEYDSTYTPRAQPVTSLNGMIEPIKHGRKDSAHSDRPAVQPISEEDEEELRQAEIVKARSQDSNWALKHHMRLYEPVMGTAPYHSLIPIDSGYHGLQRHPVWQCRRPAYIGELAIHSRPN